MATVGKRHEELDSGGLLELQMLKNAEKSRPSTVSYEGATSVAKSQPSSTTSMMNRISLIK